MSQKKALDSRHSIDSCTIHLHTWRPFRTTRTLGPSDTTTTATSYSKPYSYSYNGAHTKRPCLSDRATAKTPSFIDAAIDMSKLSLIDDDNNNKNKSKNPIYKCGSFSLIARKRRRRGSRSVSGRSSDRSGTRRCCSVGASAAYGTCSDLPVTDSSGELFVNGDGNWGSDVSEARNSRRERDGGGGGGGGGVSGSGDKENSGLGLGLIGGFDIQGNESGYGSEPGYRGDAEFGYGDEFDEEEDDTRLLFWGDRNGVRGLEVLVGQKWREQKNDPFGGYEEGK
uniref:Uncharacterized protein n=1 Tax=Fagus sylvatica TaxID=28930 RepID=A0A2N9FPU1_FAGSY